MMLLSTPKEPCWLGSATHLPLVSWTDSIIKWEKVWGFRLWNIQDYFNFLLLSLYRKCFITKCPSCHCWAAFGLLPTPSWLRATDAPHSGKQEQQLASINFKSQWMHLDLACRFDIDANTGKVKSHGRLESKDNGPKTSTSSVNAMQMFRDRDR